MKKVGIDKFYYSDVPFDANGWADAKKYAPADFDLCFLKLKEKTNCHGWISAFKWDGWKVKEGDEVISWKRI